MWVKGKSTSTSKMDNKPLLFLLGGLCWKRPWQLQPNWHRGGKEFIRKTEYLACLTCRPRGAWRFRATVRSLRTNKPLPHLHAWVCAFFCMHLCFLDWILGRLGRHAFSVYSLLELLKGIVPNLLSSFTDPYWDDKPIWLSFCHGAQRNIFLVITINWHWSLSAGIYELFHVF